MTAMQTSKPTSSSEESKSFSDHTSTLKDDVKTLKHDTYAAAATAGECISHEAERVADLAKAGGEKASEAHAALRRNVQKHPTTAVLATLGIGIVLGRLIAGR